MLKFKIGERVVPIDKTVKGYEGESFYWNAAKKNNQPFLYVNDYDFEKHFYKCGNESNSGGDFFNEVDLVLYEENTIDPNLPKITDEQLKIIEHLKESWGVLTIIEFHLSHEVWSSERAILNGIEPLDFIKVTLNNEYEIIESGLAWTLTPDELELNKFIIRSNWDTWKKAKERYERISPFSDENDLFYINVNNKGLALTVGDAKKLKEYLTQKIDYLESE